MGNPRTRPDTKRGFTMLKEGLPFLLAWTALVFGPVVWGSHPNVLAGLGLSLVLVAVALSRLRERRAGPAPQPAPAWALSALRGLYPIYLARTYAAPVVAMTLLLPWALETNKPLLVAGSSALKTGWELGGADILGALFVVLVCSLYCYAARPDRPRLVVRWFVAGFAIFDLQLEISLAGSGGFLNLATTMSHHQPAHAVATFVAGLYTASVLLEAGVIVWQWARRRELLAPVPHSTRPAGPAIDTPTGAESPQVVLLIHGTGAGADEDRGAAWWQAGSEFASRLGEALPSGVRVHEDGEVFHWSGKNSEAGRRQAGHALFAYLSRLGERAAGVHLVGHSHGGSVILHALKEAAATRTALPHLRSWTTLGTPFIHYRVDLSSIPLLLVPIVGAALILLSGDLVEHILETWPRLLEEGYYPTLAALVASGAAVVLVVAYNLWQLLGLLISFAIQRRDRRREAQAMGLYGRSWKCVWSESDEAIGGLQRATGFEGELILPVPSDEDSLSGRLLAAATAPARIAFNHIGRPVLNDSISRRLRRFAQGNDQGIAEVGEVSPWPHGGAGAPPLAPEVEHQAVQAADRSAARSISTLRSLLGTGAIAPLDTSGITVAVAGQLTGRELVHCGYYQLAAVTDEIARHIDSLAGGGHRAHGEPATRGAAPVHGTGSPASTPPRSAGSRIAGWLYASLQLAAIAAMTGVLHFLDAGVLDRFRSDRQVKEALYASLHGAVGASLRAGNVDGVLGFRREVAHAGWNPSGDPRIDLVAFGEAVKDKRYAEAEAALKRFTHPFFAMTAFAVLRGASGGDPDFGDLALSPELGIDLEPFIGIAPAVGKSEVLDPLIGSAIRLRGSPMNPDALSVGIRKLFGRLDWGWIMDSTTASARDAAALAHLHLLAWSGDREARSALGKRSGRSASISRLSLLEMALRFDADPGVPLDDDAMSMALAIARSPFAVERRALAPLLIGYGRWPDVVHLAERLGNAGPSDYGSVRYFHQFRYFALIAGLRARARGMIPDDQWKRSPYPLSQPNDLWEFADEVRKTADRVGEGRGLEPHETVGNLAGLETYGLLAVARELLAVGRRAQARRMADAALSDLLAGRGATHPAPVQADGFKRLAMLFADVGDLYRARRIGESFVVPGDRLEVWTAIVRSYRERVSSRGLDYGSHLASLWEEVDREREMRRAFDAPWNDNRW